MRWRFAMGADRRHVVDIPPAAGQQPEILLAPDPLSDRLHRHRRPPRLFPSSRRKPEPMVTQSSDHPEHVSDDDARSEAIRERKKWVPAFAGTAIVVGCSFERPLVRRRD